MTYVLRCVISPCVLPRETSQLEFDPAAVSYRAAPTSRLAARTLSVRWPVLRSTHSSCRATSERRESASTPWKADLVSMPEASLLSSRPVSLRGLLAGALLLGLAGVALALRTMPHREPEPEPAPEPEPLPVLPPLELALILLTEEVQDNGEANAGGPSSWRRRWKRATSCRSPAGHGRWPGRR